MAEHSRLIGGSTAARAIACPASIRLSAEMPPSPESEFAALGTALHEAVEYIVAKEIDDLNAVEGMTFYGTEITAELIDRKITPAITAADTLADKYDVTDVAWEQRVEFTGDLEGVFGSADLVMSSEDTLIIGDYKFGDGVAVSPVDNVQAMFYAAAAMETPEIADMCDGRDRVIVAIIQPNDNGDTLKVWETTREHVLALRPKLVEALKRSRDLSEQPKAGAHCRWCPAAATCDRMLADAHKALRLDPERAEVLSEAMGLVEQMEAWVKSVKARTRQQLTSGRAIKGWKLVPRMGNRSWTDPAALVDKANASGVAPYASAPIASPAELQRRCKKQGLDFEETFGDLVTRKVTSESLVPEDDPRAASVPLTAIVSSLARLTLTSNNKR